MGLLEGLDLFFGETTLASGQLYARCPRPCDSDSYQLVGEVRGPYSHYGRTLPAVSAWVDLGPGPELLARAVVPDPCGWSLDSPSTYRAAIQLVRDGTVVDRADRTVGFRRMGVRARSLCFDRWRWVLRGVSDTLVRGDWEEWRAARLSVVCDQLSERLCRETSLHGVPLVWRVPSGEFSEGALEAELRRWAAWPSFALVLCRAAQRARWDLRRCPNLLFACWSEGAADPTAGAAGHLLAGDASGIAAAGDRPYVAARQACQGFEHLGAARRACEQLQRDLTPHSLAGYLLLDG